MALFILILALFNHNPQQVAVQGVSTSIAPTVVATLTPIPTDTLTPTVTPSPTPTVSPLIKALILFNHTGGSIFISTLLHASIDTPQLVWIPLFLAVGMTSLNLAALIGFGVPALLIVILTRGRLGYQPNQGSNGREHKGHQAEAPTGKAEQPLLVRTWKDDPSDARHGQTEEHAFTG